MHDAEPEIDLLIATFYAAFDNRDGRQPAVVELRDLFMPDARIVRVDGERVDSWTVDAFVVPRAAMLTNGSLTGFHEWEVNSRTTVFGEIASRESEYEKSGMLDGSLHRGRGRKFIQICRVGGRWRITGILWQDSLA